MRTLFSMQVYVNKEHIRSLENKVLARREAETRCIFVIDFMFDVDFHALCLLLVSEQSFTTATFEDTII